MALGCIGERVRLRRRGDLDRASQVRLGRGQSLADGQRGTCHRAQPRVKVDAGFETWRAPGSTVAGADEIVLDHFHGRTARRRPRRRDQS